MENSNLKSARPGKERLSSLRLFSIEKKRRLLPQLLKTTSMRMIYSATTVVMMAALPSS